MQNLVDPAISYRHRAISEKIQWNAQGLAFMLNADVALFIDIQVVDFFLEMLLDIFMMSRLLALCSVPQGGAYSLVLLALSLRLEGGGSSTLISTWFRSLLAEDSAVGHSKA